MVNFLVIASNLLVEVKREELKQSLKLKKSGKAEGAKAATETKKSK